MLGLVFSVRQKRGLFSSLISQDSDDSVRQDVSPCRRDIENTARILTG